MKINRHDDGKHGYVEAIDPAGSAEMGRMKYTWAGEDKFIIDSTFVDPAYKGQGVGQKLLEDLVQLARNRGLKIIPLCPFAKAMMEKNESYTELVYR